MNKKMKFFIFFAVFLAIFHFIPGIKKELVDVITGQRPENFSIIWSANRIIFEPFVALCEYFVSLAYYDKQLISWVFWLLALCFIFGIRKKGGLRDAVSLILFSMLIFLSLVTVSLISPLPAPELKIPDSFTKIDFHSHTYYSYDAIDSPQANLRFHIKQGFDLFFATEQQNTESLSHFEKGEQLSRVFPGVQVRTTDGNALLVLGSKYFDGKKFRKKSNKEIVALAHSENLLVICPHWWKWRMPPLENIYRAGVDGFEVYNPGYMQLSETERKRTIDFCKEKKLLMISATDWHGWGAFSSVWTVFEGNPAEVKSDPVKFLKGKPKTMVVAYKRNEAAALSRYYLEPFYAIYYYFAGIDFYQCLSWLAWILVFLILSRFKRALCGLISAGFFVTSAFYIRIALSVKDNETILPLLVPVTIVLGIGWLITLFCVGKHAERTARS